MQQTVPALGARLPSEALILFPSQQALFESFQTPGNRERRMDLTGWYKLCCDFGVSADVVSGQELHDGVPEDVKLIILPANDACALEADESATAAARTALGRGCVYSFGYLYGYSYTQKAAPHVPRNMRNNELYPVFMGKQAIFREILEASRVRRSRYASVDIETGEFENGTVVVNHTSYPHFVEGYGTLPSRTACFIKK